MAIDYAVYDYGAINQRLRELEGQTKSGFTLPAGCMIALYDVKYPLHHLDKFPVVMMLQAPVLAIVKCDDGMVASVLNHMIERLKPFYPSVARSSRSSMVFDKTEALALAEHIRRIKV